MTPRGYAYGKGHHESPVHRNPYDTHDAYDAIRTQDADLAVSKYVKFFSEFSKFFGFFLFFLVRENLARFGQFLKNFF